ncbi:MAG: AbgT family transporter [Bacteroidaceae bacterium]|nr:AbgT family transporter [Bacteroidaceae bacterium]
MNRKSLGIWHPAMLYLFLSIAVILIAWVGSFWELRNINVNSELILRSLLTIDGVRYLLHNSVSLLDDAPIANILMLLFTIGVANRSLLFKTLSLFLHHKSLSYKQYASLLLSFIVFVLMFVLLIYGVFGPEHLLLSISGTLKNSPLIDGFFAILMILVLLPCLIYGMATDSFNVVDDGIEALVSVIRLVPSYLFTLFMASFLMSVITYSRIDVLIGAGTTAIQLFSQILYWLPLPILLFFEQKSEI